MCKQFLSVENFGKKKENINGLRDRCKECRRIEKIEAKGLSTLNR